MSISLASPSPVCCLFSACDISLSARQLCEVQIPYACPCVLSLLFSLSCSFVRLFVCLLVCFMGVVTVVLLLWSPQMASLYAHANEQAYHKCAICLPFSRRRPASWSASLFVDVGVCNISTVCCPLWVDVGSFHCCSHTAVSH